MSYAEDVAKWIRDANPLRIDSWCPSPEAERLIRVYQQAKSLILENRFSRNLNMEEQAGSLLVIYGPHALAALDLQPESLKKSGRRMWPGLRERLADALKGSSL